MNQYIAASLVFGGAMIALAIIALIQAVWGPVV